MGYNRKKGRMYGEERYTLMGENRIIRIAICDDEKALCSELEEELMGIARQININVQIDVWFSGETLIKYLSEGNYLDIVFLDIELMKLSGIDVGAYIRNEMNDIKTQIVYISSKTSYALQLFKTQPYDFLVKPISRKDLYKDMEGIVKILFTQNCIFEYHNGREKYQIEYNKILYFISDRHKVIIVTQNGEMEYYGKLKNVIDDAPPQFLAIHKSYLINRNYVEKYTFKYIEMQDHKILPISKAYQKSVREKLSQMR